LYFNISKISGSSSAISTFRDLFSIPLKICANLLGFYSTGKFSGFVHADLMIS
jgi:hypothetical protein